MAVDQERFVGLVRVLFSEPHEASVNNDLPLEDPVDFHWTDPTGAYRLRLYIQDSAVLAVNESARPGEAWGGERRVLVDGANSVRIAREIEDLLEAES